MTQRPRVLFHHTAGKQCWGDAPPPCNFQEEEEKNPNDFLERPVVTQLAPWKTSYDKPRQHIKKQRHYFDNKGPSSQGYGFSNGHVWRRKWQPTLVFLPRESCGQRSLVGCHL